MCTSLSEQMASAWIHVISWILFILFTKFVLTLILSHKCVFFFCKRTFIMHVFSILTAFQNKHTYSKFESSRCYDIAVRNECFLVKSFAWMSCGFTYRHTEETQSAIACFSFSEIYPLGVFTANPAIAILPMFAGSLSPRRTGAEDCMQVFRENCNVLTSVSLTQVKSLL